MHQPIKVDAPSVFPHACVQCHGATGPLVDTHVENRFGDRVYMCASCIRVDAIVLGLLDGKEHTRLLESAEEQSDVARKLAAVIKQREKATERVKAQDVLLEEFKSNLEWAEQRIAQLEALVRADATAALSVVDAV